MRPFRGGAVTHNGVALYRETVLKPGDVIGLGNHFLFLYRDPRVTPAPPLALTLPWQADASITCCPSGLVDRQEALRQYLGSTEAELKFHPRHADTLLQVRHETKKVFTNYPFIRNYKEIALLTYVVFIPFLLGDNLQKFLPRLWRRAFSSCVSPVNHDRSCLQTPWPCSHATDITQVCQPNQRNCLGMLKKQLDI